jgi:Virulence activator alpha C-term
MVLRYGVAHSEFNIRWCDEALAELSAEHGEPGTRRRSA